MRIDLLSKTVLVVAAIWLTPAVLSAYPKAAQPYATAGPSQATFSNDAARMLQRIQTDAFRVRNDAGELQAVTRNPLMSDWREDGGLLDRVRNRVNEMDKLLYRLRVNEPEASARQQKAINRIAPSVVNLTDTTQDAVVSLNHHQGGVYFSHLDGLASDMYSQASAIDKAMVSLEQHN